ncbi:hypothetical protein ACWGJ9_08080 [Curtobacterium citreum]
MTDQTLTPAVEPKLARSQWDSALAPVIRGIGMLLLAAAFAPLPASAGPALLYFGAATFLLGGLLGVASVVVTLWQYIGSDAYDEQADAFTDRVDRLRMRAGLHFTLLGIGVGAFFIAASTDGPAALVASSAVAVVFAFTGIRTIITATRIWSRR